MKQCFNIYQSECSRYSRKAQILNKRARNMKLVSIFFKATTRNKRCLRRREVYLPKGVRHSRPKEYVRGHLKDSTYKRARNMKQCFNLFCSSGTEATSKTLLNTTSASHRQSHPRQTMKERPFKCYKHLKDWQL